ncbi:hypothetical protein GCM10023108_06580 [Saccharopolyspora hordei]
MSQGPIGGSPWPPNGPWRAGPCAPRRRTALRMSAPPGDEGVPADVCEMSLSDSSLRDTQCN